MKMSAMAAGMLLVFSCPLGAQTLAPEDKADVSQRLKSRIGTLVQPADTGGASPGAYSRLAVEANSEKSTALFKVAKSWVFVGDRTGTSVYDTTGNLALSASTPFDSDKDKQKDLGDLSGLSAGTGATLTAGSYFWQRVAVGTVFTLDQTCNQAVADLVSPAGYSFAWPEQSTDNPTPAQTALLFQDQQVDCTLMLADDAGLLAAVDAVNAANKAKAKGDPSFTAPPPATAKVGPKNPRDFYKKQYHGQVQEARKASHGLTLALSANRQSFTYASAEDPTDVTKDEIQNGYGATLGYQLVLDTAVLLVGATKEKAYKGAKQQQICSPLGQTGSLTCANAALAAPSKAESTILSTELRWRLGRSFPVAIAPRVQFRTDDSEFGFQLPIYLAADGKRPLEGGLKLTWTDEDDFGAGVFVGKSFKFFN